VRNGGPATFSAPAAGNPKPSLQPHHANSNNQHHPIKRLIIPLISDLTVLARPLRAAEPVDYA